MAHLLLTIVRRSLLAALVLVVAAGLAPRPAEARQVPPELSRAIAATVQIFTLDRRDEIVGSGSGSIVGRSGQILTNFHVVGDRETGKLYHPKGLVQIALTTSLQRPAQPMFYAQVVAERSDPKLDLAVLQIVADLDGYTLEQCLDLPTLPIGDSDELAPRETLTIIGFPGIGGNSYTVTEGRVSGFSSSTTGRVFWIKTDATLAPGNSGGTAIGPDGALVGVPTGGRIDDSAPAQLGLVRPINLAKPLLANLGELTPDCAQGGVEMLDLPAAELQRARANFDTFFQKSAEQVFESFDRGMITRRSWSESASSELREKVYILSNNVPGTLSSYFWQPERQPRVVGGDYIVQADVAFRSQGGLSGVGITVGGQTNGSGVSFIIQSDGTWRVIVLGEDGYDSELSTGAVTTRAIVGGTNQLRVVRIDDQLQFWINHTPVAVLDEAPFESGYAGLAVLAGEQAPLAQVVTDNFTVRLGR